MKDDKILINGDFLKTDHLKSEKAVSNQECNRSVLLVEDHAIQALIASTLLGDRGCKVDVAPTGEIAIAKAQKNNNYDLMLVDVGLPDTDGFELTKRIRVLEQSSKSRNFIVGYSAHIDEQKRNKGLEIGMDLVLIKPLTDQLIDLLLMLIEHYRSKPMKS